MIFYVILSWCFCWIWLWNWLVFELCVCGGFKRLCFRYLWTRVVITMWTPMYARYLWTSCEMDVACGLLCWIMYDLGCMRVGLKSFMVSVDYRVYMGSSMTVWSLRWLLSYLYSYKLVGSVTVTKLWSGALETKISILDLAKFLSRNNILLILVRPIWPC